MLYIRRRNNYFMTEAGDPWIPIGFNDNLLSRVDNDDLSLLENYFVKLSDYRINCLKISFESAKTTDGFLETVQGVFNEDVVSRWKKIFDLCRKYNIRLLISPYDTIWQWKNWKNHPYNIENGGYLRHPSSMLSDPLTMEVHKHRLGFLIENFSHDGTIFAWDLWDRIDPCYDNESSGKISSYMEQMGSFISEYETRLFGRRHLQTCSILLPTLIKHDNSNLMASIFRNSRLDFCNVHLYNDDDPTMGNPRNVIEPSLKVGTLVKDCIGQIKDGRPFFDSGSGSIKVLGKNDKQLEESFDEQCFRNMCWVHVASGGAGPGLRFFNEQSSSLSMTDGMLNVLRSLAEFGDTIDWNKFNRECLNNVVLYNNKGRVGVFCCGGGSKFILFAMRTDHLDSNGLFKKEKRPSSIDVKISIPDVYPGTYKLCQWSDDGKQASIFTQNSEQEKGKSSLTFLASINRGLVLYIDRI